MTQALADTETVMQPAPVFSMRFMSSYGFSGVNNDFFNAPEIRGCSPDQQTTRVAAAVYFLRLLTPHTQSPQTGKHRALTNIDLTINEQPASPQFLKAEFDKLLGVCGTESGQVMTAVVWALAQQNDGQNDFNRDLLKTYARAYDHRDVDRFVNAAWYRFLESIQQRTA